LDFDEMTFQPPQDPRPLVGNINNKMAALDRSY